jgi:hypothetical protein
MQSVEIVFGARQLDRIVTNADELLRQHRQKDIGSGYLDYKPITPGDRVLPEDLAVTLLLNSRAGYRAFQSIQQHGSEIDLAALPAVPLEQTSEDERICVAEVIAKVASWPGIAASTATKVLHKKRPDLIPILDNQAIFGAYMKPERPSPGSVRDRYLIQKALDWITIDLCRSENQLAWLILQEIETTRTRIQLFDCVWWMYCHPNDQVSTIAIRA